VDLDATIIESHKREALRTYEGERGYQPMLGVWAETELILADEFRDGNVPPMYAPLTIAQRAFAALPASVNEFYFRGDSACYERKLMRWLNDPEREAGPKGFIGFAISVRIHPQLRTILEQIPDTEWKPAPAADPNQTHEYSEVPFEPGQPYEGKNQQSLRYLGIRIRRHQGQLFDGTAEVKHFAVVTNMPLPAAKLIPWHREKAGSIERIHDVLKNELAAGVLPCGRFGANAAWFRLAVISHNIITALKRIALPAKYLAARPKRMRFLFFHLPGRLVQHARAMWLRVASLAELIGEMQEAFQALPLRS
jgi:Transposase DDE domain group 1